MSERMFEASVAYHVVTRLRFRWITLGTELQSTCNDAVFVEPAPTMRGRLQWLDSRPRSTTDTTTGAYKRYRESVEVGTNNLKIIDGQGAGGEVQH